MLNPYELQVFLAAAEEESFSAARADSISPSLPSASKSTRWNSSCRSSCFTAMGRVSV